MPAMAQESELPAQGPVTSTVLLLGLRLVLGIAWRLFLEALCSSGLLGCVGRGV